MNRRDVLAEEVQWLLSFGEHPLVIAGRFGLKPGSVATSLHRADEHDLAKPFDQAQRELRRRRCGCGRRISQSATWCPTCSANERERARHIGLTHCPRHRCPRYLDEHGRCATHGDQSAAIAA